MFLAIPGADELVLHVDAMMELTDALDEDDVEAEILSLAGLIELSSVVSPGCKMEYISLYDNWNIS